MTAIALAKHLLFCAGLALLSAVVVRLMIGAGVMDRPDPRKAHRRPVPKGGGVGIVAAFLVGLLALYGFAVSSRIADPYFRGVILASVAIAAVAWGDDTHDWPFWVKLGAQLAAALLAVGSGLYVATLSLPWAGRIELGLAGAAGTVVWILFVTNAMNFIDGLNGLAAGVSALACAVLAGIAASQGGWFAYFTALLLLSGLLGFLPFNFPRARIFMGDVGSQFCGFVLAVLGVAAGRFEQVPLSALLVPMLLAGVLFDVGFTLVRRMFAGARLSQPHRGHLYQLAHRCGVPAVAVTLLHWGFVLWGGACCWLFLSTGGPEKALVPLLVLPPQLAWAGWVLHRARGREIGPW